MAIDIMAAFESEPPQLDFIWPGFLAGSVGALVAPGGAGKSFWALEAAMAVACHVPGGDLLGLAPEHTGRVIYLAAEDPETALVNRVHFIGAHLPHAARKSIAENFILEPVLGRRLDVMKDRHVARIVDFCAGARLIVLDTLSRIHGLEENDNGQMARLIAQMEYVAATIGASVLFLHHVSKASAREKSNDQQAARGASALVDNSRWCGFLAMMSESESKFLSDRYDRKPIEERRCYFVRFGISKQNYAPFSDEQWFQRHPGGVLVPVDLVEATPANQSKGGGRYVTAAY